MIPISCRFDESFFKQLNRFPVATEKRVCWARMKSQKVVMKFESSKGKAFQASEVASVLIDWGMVSASGNQVSEHTVRILPINRVTLDDIGDVDTVVTADEPFIEVTTYVGFTIQLPLFDTDLYKRVIAFKRVK